MRENNNNLECESGEFSHWGMSGDCIYALPTIKHLGGGLLFLCHGDGTHFSAPDAHSLAQLISKQKYVYAAATHLQIHSPLATKWRECLDSHPTLAGIQARAQGIDDDRIFDEPWLSVEPKRVASVVFSRTGKVRGKEFPWKEIVDKYHEDAVFLGHPHEYESFCLDSGNTTVPYYHTASHLEAAEIMAASDLYVSNQSSLLAVAEGLKIPSLTEMPSNIPDARTNLMRGNAYPIYTGEAVDFERVELLRKGEVGYLPKWNRRVLLNKIGTANVTPYSVYVRQDKSDYMKIEDINIRNDYKLDRIFHSGMRPQKIVDVGANIGMFSAACRALWPESKIHSIEPNGTLFPLLQINAKGCEIYIGAASKPGIDVCYLRMNEYDHGGSTTSRSGSREGALPCRTLDEWTGADEIDILKLDCEGAEWDILEHLTSKPKLIVGEAHGYGSEDRIRSLLFKLGYSVETQPLCSVLTPFYASI